MRLPNSLLRFVCGWRGRTPGYFPRHFHRVVEMVYHPRGEGITTLENGRDIHFSAHGIVIYPARLSHDQRMIASGEDICVHVAAEGAWRRLLGDAIYIPPSAPGGRADRFVRTEFLNLCRMRTGEARGRELDLRVTALLLRLLQLGREEPREASTTAARVYVDRAREYIREHYARISGVEEISRHAGVSEDYLRHLFLARGGTSPGRLLCQTRLERARELLAHSRLPLKEIAALSGFSTERYLSTCFRRAFGINPRAFRLDPPSASRAAGRG